MEVVWTDQAFLRLMEIEDYIARDNPAAAQRHTDKLVARSETIAQQPQLGRVLPELPASGIRELVEGNYRIVYRVGVNRVEILTVFESHRRLPLNDLPGSGRS